MLGVALQAGCIALAVWARRHLGRNWSGAVRIAVDHQLVAVALIGVAYWRKIRMEERILGETFGDEFDAYQRDSWALIPFVI